MGRNRSNYHKRRKRDDDWGEDYEWSSGEDEWLYDDSEYRRRSYSRNYHHCNKDDWDDDIGYRRKPYYRNNSFYDGDDWDEEEYDDWKDDGYYPRFDPKYLGEYGEQLTEENLQVLRSLQKTGKILRNAYIPKPNGKTSEIDLLFITHKGVFVIESKNFSGWIFGNEKDRQWTASFPNGERRRFYNPVLQNNNHIKWLKHFLGFNFPCYSLIVFSERCELKKITVNAPGVGVVKRDSLVPLLLECWDKFKNCLSDDMIETIFSRLLPCVKADEKTKRKHNNTCF